MIGPGHWREADLILTSEGACEHGCLISGCPHEMAQLARAQAHATLALAAAAALAGMGAATEPGLWAEWRKAVTSHG